MERWTGMDETTDRPVRVGIAGGGEFGRMCAAQLDRIDDVTLVGVADPDERRARACIRAGGGEPSAAADPGDVSATDRTIAIVDDGVDLARADVDVLLEATGELAAGARHAFEAIMHDTHVAMATCEADAVVGPVLSELARNAGVGYAPAAGDQPALVSDLVRWARACGFEVVAAGRGVRTVDPNVAIESAVAANATGLAPAADGLHLPTVGLQELANVLRPTEDGGRLADPGVIDAVEVPPDQRGSPGASIGDGVFVVVSTPDEDVRRFVVEKNRAGAYPDDAGRYVTFARPHHVPGVETPRTIRRLTSCTEPYCPTSEHVSDVVAVARTNVGPGDDPVRIHRTDPDDRFRADLRRVEDVRAAGLVPYGLLNRARIIAPLAPGEVVTADHVELRPTFVHHLRGIGDRHT